MKLKFSKVYDNASQKERLVRYVELEEGEDPVGMEAPNAATTDYIDVLKYLLAQKQHGMGDDPLVDHFNESPISIMMNADVLNDEATRVWAIISTRLIGQMSSLYTEMEKETQEEIDRLTEQGMTSEEATERILNAPPGPITQQVVAYEIILSQLKSMIEASDPLSAFVFYFYFLQHRISDGDGVLTEESLERALENMDLALLALGIDIGRAKQEDVDLLEEHVKGIVFNYE